MKRINLRYLLLLLLFITQFKSYAQYCTSGLGGNCANRAIADVIMANMSNIGSSCTTPYTDYTGNASLQINVVAGQSYYLKVNIDGATTAKIAAWIDWNQDSTWSTAAEFYNICTTLCLSDSILITVPTTALNGSTRLRVRSRNGANFGQGQSCNNIATGEIEDYTIVVTGGISPSPYCASEPSTAADDDIGIFTLASFTNTSVPNTASVPTNNSLAIATYSDFTGLAPISLLSPLTVPISITQVNEFDHFACFAKVWIDLNHDSVFQDPGELVFTSLQSQDPTVTPGGNILTGTIALPPIGPNVLTGITRMRVVLSEEDPSTTISPCTNIDYAFGETEDYLVDIQQASGCFGVPTAGTVTLSNDTVCAGEFITLSLNGSTAASGITYQWQSASSLAGPYTNINGANAVTYVDTVIANLFFQCIVTCTNSGQNSTTAPEGYFVKAPNFCICTSNADFTDDDDIGNVTFASLNNGIGTPALNNPSSVNTYTDFTNLPPTVLLSPLSIPIQITQINQLGFFACGTKVWIDFNQDGIFQDSTELVYNSPRTQNPNTVPNGNVLNGVVQMPNINGTSIKSGVTIMRIVLSEDPNNLILPCGVYDFGETEDYLVDVQQAAACTGTPAAGTTASNDTSVCIGQIINLSLVGNTAASGLTYQWQLNGVNILGATSQNYIDTITGPSVYDCIVTCTSTSSSSTSTTLTLSINPFSICYCAVNPGATFGTDIGNVTVGSFSNGIASPIIGNAAANGTYTNFTNLAPIPLFIGIPNAISVTGITSSTFVSSTTFNGRVYIDYNQDGAYDPVTELAVSGSGNYTAVNGSIISGSPVVPTTALTGITGMRVMLIQGPITNACTIQQLISGEVEDYFVDIQAATSCFGAPNTGVATTTDTFICPKAAITLNVSSATLGIGITYQWQSSSSITGPYTNITNATSLAYFTDSVSTPTYFQCISTCSNSGLSATSSPIFVNVKSFLQCYCNTNLSGSCSPNAENIVFNSLNNPSTLCIQANGQAYTVFPPTGALTTTVLKGVTYPLSLVSSGGAPNQITAFIDYNRDGVFDNTTERINVLPSTPFNTQTVFSVPVLIPTTADTGLTVLRIRIRAASFTGPCDPLGSGETEDYTIRIIDGTPCTGVPSVVNLSSNDLNVCGNNFTLSIDTIVPASGISYSWTANGVPIPAATNPSFVTTQSSTTTYVCTVSCAAGGSTTTNSITVTQNPADSCYCFTGLGGFCNSASIDGFTISQTALGVNTATNLDNQSNGCSTGVGGQAYTAYGFGVGTDATLAKTDSFTVEITTAGVGTASQAKVFSDWNRDGVWNNTNELLTVCSPCNSNTVSATYLIDPSVNIGDTIRIRVRTRQSTIANACESLGSGETEDYFIVIGNTTVLSITNVAAKTISTIKLYPNPTTGILNYELPATAKNASISVSDLLGRILISKSAVNTKSIDLSELKNGTYNLVMNLDGKIIQNKVILNK